MNADLIANKSPTPERFAPLLSEPEEDPLLSPGREALIQTVKDAHQFEEQEEDDFKDARDTAADADGLVVPLFEKKTKRGDDQKKKKDKEEREAERKAEKKTLEAEFQKIWSESAFDPYKGVSLDKGDGKIQVEENGVPAKYRYFIKKRPQALGDFKKYFKEYDWKMKGVVRKRFEALRWPQLLNPGYELKDLKESLKVVREAMKALEEISGKIPALKHILSDQQVKYNFLVKPRQYYKDFC